MNRVLRFPRPSASGPEIGKLQAAQSFHHCPRCGFGPGVPVEGAVLACPSCGFRFHFNPAVAVGVVLSGRDGRLLLVRRAHAPGRGLLGVPGGFVDAGESAEAALRRETREETGLELEELGFLGGWPNLYAWRGVEYPVLDLYFSARACEGSAARAGEEVEDCVWLRPDEIQPAELAFDSTRTAFERWRRLGPRPGPAPGAAPDGPPQATLDKTSLGVVLVEPEIHWNTGNAGRTCLAAGAQLHLVEPLGFALDERELRRAGLDYWERVAPRLWPGWDAFAQALPALGEPFFVSPEATVPYWDVRYPERTLLVFGRESVGLPRALRERYRDRLVSVPMHDPALRSLNLSTCVGVLLYEVLRQRRAARR